MGFTDYIVPLIVLFILFLGIVHKNDIFELFTEGAKDGLNTTFDILPSLICLMTCIGMLKSSGFLAFLSDLISPLTDVFGFPKECTPLIFIRPLSGSGALSVYNDIISQYGPDSTAGKIASVMMGSSETTFYTIAVYFGAAKIKKTRHMLPAALSADMTVWIISAAIVRLLF